MATKIYLPSSGAPAVTPSSWIFPEQINPLEFAGVVARINSALTTKTEPTGTTSPIQRVMLRYVIGPLAAQSISGTVRMVMRCREANAGANATLAMAVKIIQPNGADRATLLAVTSADSASSPYEFTTTLDSRRCWKADETEPLDLTTQSATEGDYLVIEIGFRSATTVSRNIDLRYGDDNASDLTYGDAETNDFNPWVEFSATITFSSQTIEESISAARSQGIAAASQGELESAALLGRQAGIATGENIEIDHGATLAATRGAAIDQHIVVEETLYDVA